MTFSTIVTNSIANHRIAKILIAVLGGYAFTSGFVALSSVLLAKLGMHLGEAVVLSGLLGLLVYPMLIFWVFTTSQHWRTYSTIAVSAAAMIILSPYLASPL